MGPVLFWLGIIVLILLFCMTSVYYLALRPPREPRGIPTIPFWVALIPLWKDVDQRYIFKRFIEKPLHTHGAVKIFFASQWNVLVHRPTYLASILKHESVYQKSGNQKKIPNSVLASFLGDNIISSHGETWKLYHGIVKPGLQRTFDHGMMLTNAHKLRDILIGDQEPNEKKGILIQESFQRCTISNIAQGVLGVDFGTLNSKSAYMNTLQSSIKREIFKPIFMNFPFLDTVGFPSRERARRLASHFTDQLVEAIEGARLERIITGKPQLESVSSHFTKDLAGASLLDGRLSGQLTEQQFRDNLTVTFVAGQENPQLALISTMYLLAKHSNAQELLYKEVMSVETEESLCQKDLQEMPFLAAVVLESLRLFPPIGQLINRRAAESVALGDGIIIPKGTYLGYNCYSTNRDPVAWGVDADIFRPQRWGKSIQDIHKAYRRRKARAEFITFHGGSRACLGERFALLEIKATLFVLARDLCWKLDPTWPDRMTSAGPLCPRNLRLMVKRRAG